MLNWVSQHQAVLATLISFGTLIVWLVYAQLLYLGFRRQRRPRVIINRGKRKDIDALCIISNMSTEAIFIEYIIAELETSRGSIIMDVTDYDQEYDEGDEVNDAPKERRALAPGPVNESTRQGPLESGGFLHIGTFNDLIKRLARRQGVEMQGPSPKGGLQFRSLTIRLIAIYGPEDKPIGAERGFNLSCEEGEEHTLTPFYWDTRRLASPRQRRRLRKELNEMNGTSFSMTSTFRHDE